MALDERQTSKDTILEMNAEEADIKGNMVEPIVDQKGEHREEIVHTTRFGVLTRLRRRYREELAEFMGTFIMIVFGVGVVAQVVTHPGGSKGEYLSINLSWGLGVLFGVYAAGGISGAHLNPAVTLGVAAHCGFAWKKVPGFIIAQMLGAFCAAAVVYLNYRDAISAFDGGVRTITGDTSTAGIFATYPQPYLSTGGAFFSEFFGTAILAIGLRSIGEAKSADAPKGHSPIAVALLVMGIGMSLGSETGYAINPARDFGPRLFTSIAGWGGDVYTAANNYAWIPIVGPVLGAQAGHLIYGFFAEYKSVDSKAVTV
ncbi:putative channel-like protein [Powellomyces hirtus]|nr:putative channel-like protein [Powellomyces hirtus]